MPGIMVHETKELDILVLDGMGPGVMLYIILLSSFCPPKFDVVLKITIEFMIDHY
jgi:hypothetical protein